MPFHTSPEERERRPTNAAPLPRYAAIVQADDEAAHRGADIRLERHAGRGFDPHPAHQMNSINFLPSSFSSVRSRVSPHAGAAGPAHTPRFGG